MVKRALFFRLLLFRLEILFMLLFFEGYQQLLTDKHDFRWFKGVVFLAAVVSFRDSVHEAVFRSNLCSDCAREEAAPPDSLASCHGGAIRSSCFGSGLPRLWR